MQFDGDLVDKIVSGVLERLQARPEVPRADHPPGNRSSSPPASTDGQVLPVPTTPESLHLAEKVVTAELLEQRLGGHRRINVTTGAVLTPSAREFLQRRKIEWVRGNGTPGAQSSGGLAWKVIILTSTPSVLGAVEEVIRGGSPRWQRELAASEQESLELATSAVCRGESPGVVVLSDRSDRLVCRLNRNPRVRAAVVADVRRVEAVRREIGANVIAVPPAGKSYFELRNILRAFAAGGPPRTPDGWDG